MNNLKYSFREFKRSLLFKILIIIQIIVAIIMLYRVNEIKNYENGKLTSLQKIISNKIIYKFSSQYGSMESLIDDQQNTNKFSKFSNDVSKEYTIVTVTYGELFMKYFDNIDKFVDKDIANMIKENDENYKPLNSLQCSSNFFDVFNIKLLSGSWSEFDEYTMNSNAELNGEIVPVILGYDYKNIYKLNEIIEAKDKKCRVVGFLDKNQFYLDKGIYHPSKVKSLDNFAILPSPRDIMDANIGNSLLVVPDSNSVEFDNIRDNIDKISKKDNVQFSLYDPSQDIDDFISVINYNSNIKILIAYIVMSFVIIGLSVIFSNKVIHKKKEFSIHVMYGASFQDIYIRVFLEHMYSVALAIIIAIVYLQNRNTEVITDILTFDIKAFIQSSALIFIIVILVTMIPIYNIKKHKINYLIKGD